MTFLRTLACAFALAWSLAAPAVAQGSRVDLNADSALEIESYCPLPPAANNGWIPIRLRIKNLTDEDVERTLTFKSANWHRLSVESKSELRLAPNEEREMQLLVPYFEAARAENVRLLLEHGPEVIDVETVFSVGSSSSNDSAIPALLIEEGDLLSTNSAIITIAQQQLTFSAIPKANLPADWRALSTLGVVVLDVASVLPDPAQMDAISRWVALGGSLVLHGPRGVAESTLAVSGVELQDRLRITRGESRPDIYRHGLGRIAVNPATGPQLSLGQLIPSEGWNFAADRSDQEGPPQGCFPPVFASSQLSLPGVGSPPVSGLAALLIIVALVMGPIQFQMLKKRNAPPYRFLQITPLLGLFFLVSVLSFSLLSQGIAVRETVQSVTWIDQGTKQASTLARRSSFSGSLLAQRLRFDEASLLVPSSRTHSSRVTRRYSIDLDQGNTLSGAFMPTRAPASTASATSETFRGGLRLERDGSQLYVINELDRELNQLRVRDESGTHYKLASGGSLPVGARMELVSDSGIAEVVIPNPVSPPPIDVIQGLELVTTDSSIGLDMRHFPRILPLRSWKATVADSPFVPDGGVTRKAGHQAHLWIGLLEDVQ